MKNLETPGKTGRVGRYVLIWCTDMLLKNSSMRIVCPDNKSFNIWCLET